MRVLFCSVLLVGLTHTVWAQNCPSMPKFQDTQVVAEWAGKKLTLGQLDKKLGQALCQAKLAYEMKVSELRQEALESTVYSALLDAEAQRLKKSSADALLSSEVVEKVKNPSENEMKAFYAKHKDEIGDRTLDDVRDQIRDFLRKQKTQEAVAAYMKSLKAKAKVKLALPVFRFPVKPTGPSRGPKDAKITIVEFADYECPFCARGAQVIKEVVKKYPKDVRVVFKDFTLDFHANAIPAAIAARCAGKQGKYWEMHEILFENVQELGAESLRGYAKKIGLDLKTYDQCITEPGWPASIRADEEEGARYGVEGTPAFFINGIPLSGAQPLEKFVEIIERELTR